MNVFISQKTSSRLKTQLDSEFAARQQMETERTDALSLNKKLERQIRDLSEQLREAKKKESDISFRNQHLVSLILLQILLNMCDFIDPVHGHVCGLPQYL